MPLHLADFALERNLPDRYCRALMEMRFDVLTEPVTPAVAARLIQMRLRLLLPESKRHLLELEGQPSWDRLQVLFPRLMFESNRGQDEDLVAAATLVDILVRFSTRPERDMKHPQFIEVNSFARVCGYLRLPAAAPQMKVVEQDVGLYDFCKFCWLPALSRGLCQFHSMRSLPIEPPNRQPVCALVTFKTAKRFRPAFEKKTVTLATAEELAFHNSEFAMQILLPMSGLRLWLEDRRPTLARLIGAPRSSPDTTVLSDLLAALYGVRGADLKAALGPAVHLLTPVTLRAEAWLAAWHERPTWGGARRSRPEGSM
jgi:hypothetical protein